MSGGWRGCLRTGSLPHSQVPSDTGDTQPEGADSASGHPHRAPHGPACPRAAARREADTRTHGQGLARRKAHRPHPHLVAEDLVEGGPGAAEGAEEGEPEPERAVVRGLQQHHLRHDQRRVPHVAAELRRHRPPARRDGSGLGGGGGGAAQRPLTGRRTRWAAGPRDRRTAPLRPRLLRLPAAVWVYLGGLVKRAPILSAEVPFAQQRLPSADTRGLRAAAQQG